MSVKWGQAHFICQRWNEGITDAAALHAELLERGRTGSVRTVRR
jgi:hypothetical protein